MVIYLISDITKYREFTEANHLIYMIYTENSFKMDF